MHELDLPDEPQDIAALWRGGAGTGSETAGACVCTSETHSRVL